MCLYVSFVSWLYSHLMFVLLKGCAVKIYFFDCFELLDTVWFIRDILRSCSFKMLLGHTKLKRKKCLANLMFLYVFPLRCFALAANFCTHPTSEVFVGRFSLYRHTECLCPRFCSSSSGLLSECRILNTARFFRLSNVGLSFSCICTILAVSCFTGSMCLYSAYMFFCSNSSLFTFSCTGLLFMPIDQLLVLYNRVLHGYLF